MDAYLPLKFFHILFAIVAVGSNISYGIWIARASKSPASLPTVLRTIKFIDDRIANPCYGLLLLSGLGLVSLGDWSFGTHWVQAAIGLWVVMAVLGGGFFTRSLRRQIQALDRFGFNSEAYGAAARRSRMMGLLTALPVVGILLLMVFKPAF